MFIFYIRSKNAYTYSVITVLQNMVNILLYKLYYEWWVYIIFVYCELEWMYIVKSTYKSYTKTIVIINNLISL